MTAALNFEEQVFAQWNVVAIFGGSLWDEGKGKVVSLFRNVDRVATPTWWGNAWHTVYYEWQKIALHELPWWAIIDKARVYLWQGRVINIADLWTEMKQLQNAGLSLDAKVVIAGNAHLIFNSLQRSLDGTIEQLKSRKVWTTKKGIGPAYALKALRTSITPNILLNSPDRVQELISLNIALFPWLDEQTIMDEIHQAHRQLTDLITQWYISIDSTCMQLNHERKQGKRILIESSQSALLAIDGGMYPYCTSSDTTANGIGSGLNIPHIDTSIAVFKAIKSKVGWWYFPTKFEDEVLAESYRSASGEYGATTGRARDVGWFDCVETRRVLATNQVDIICITKADVLSYLGEVKYGRHYLVWDERYDDTIPTQDHEYDALQVQWSNSYQLSEDIANLQDPTLLPVSYLDYITDLVDELWFTWWVLLGTWPDRDDICIFR